MLVLELGIRARMARRRVEGMSESGAGPAFASGAIDAAGMRGVESASSSSSSFSWAGMRGDRREGPAMGVRVSAGAWGECLVSLRRGMGRMGEVSMSPTREAALGRPVATTTTRKTGDGDDNGLTIAAWWPRVDAGHVCASRDACVQRLTRFDQV